MLKGDKPVVASTSDESRIPLRLITYGEGCTGTAACDESRIPLRLITYGEGWTAHGRPEYDGRHQQGKMT